MNIKSSVAVTCFLPGRAKDLSAHPVLITWIDKCKTKIAGCGTIHTHTNIHNCYSVKYNEHVKKMLE